MGISLVGLLLVAGLTTSFSQSLDSALAYFPLSVRDYWEYEQRWTHISGGPPLLTYSVTAGPDTLMPNGIAYRTLTTRRSDGLTYLDFRRVDSTTAIVYANHPYGGPPFDFQIDSLLAQPGDWFTSWSGVFARCILHTVDTILAYPTHVKHFWFGVSKNYTFAYGLGLVYKWEEDVFHFHRRDDLVYARIAGRAYGTPLAVSPPLNEQPQMLSVSQNYPNPFNSSTIITYQLPRSERVVLLIQDILGREVQRIEEGKKGPGEHQIPVQSSFLSSGIYFYTVMAGSSSITKTMHLVR